MSQFPDKTDFETDTANHEMKVLHDDGLYRHLTFTNNGSNIFRFDLITWPGYLTITGDMGTYTFSRIEDMFLFFGDSFDTQYWTQKLQSADQTMGYNTYSYEKFEECVMDEFESFWEDREDAENKQKHLDLLNETLLGGETDEYSVVEKIRNYEDDEFGFNLNDFFYDHSLTVYTYQYVWCLYAIVWGIKQYEEIKNGQESESKTS